MNRLLLLFVSAIMFMIAVPVQAGEVTFVPAQPAVAPTAPHTAPAIDPKTIPSIVDVNTLKQDVANLQHFRDSLKQNPSLTEEQRKLLQELAQIDRLVPKLERLRDGTPTTYLTRDEQATLASVASLKQEIAATHEWRAIDFVYPLLLVIAFIGLWRLHASFKVFKQWVFREMRILYGRIHDIEDRYDVRINRIQHGPHRTYTASDMRSLSPGDMFEYFVLVDNKLARYTMMVTGLTKDELDVQVSCTHFASNVTSERVHKSLCRVIEDNGGMHPCISLAA